MKNFANRFVLSNSIHSVCLAIVSLAILCHVPGTAIAQQNELNEARARQSKMMETEFLMVQVMQLGHNADMRKELEIVDDQVDDLKKMTREHQAAMMEFNIKNSKMMVEIQELLKEDKAFEAMSLNQKYQEKIQELSDKYMEKVSGTLLPHQIDRLLQISKQQRIKSTNQFSDEFGIPAALADEVGLSKREKEKLIEVIKAARKEYYEKVEALKKVANEKIMNSLTTEQRAKMREILGDTFDQEKSRRRNMDAIDAKQKEAKARQR